MYQYVNYLAVRRAGVFMRVFCAEKPGKFQKKQQKCLNKPLGAFELRSLRLPDCFYQQVMCKLG
jgi:hypothetical protein